MDYSASSGNGKPFGGFKKKRDMIKATFCKQVVLCFVEKWTSWEQKACRDGLRLLPEL